MNEEKQTAKHLGRRKTSKESRRIEGGGSAQEINGVKEQMHSGMELAAQPRPLYGMSDSVSVS